jgi:hypothetical protein
LDASFLCIVVQKQGFAASTPAAACWVGGGGVADDQPLPSNGR